MKSIVKYLVVCFLFCGSVWAQGQTSTARRIIYAASLPSTCNPNTGDVYFKTTATVGPYYCSATNTWSSMAVGSGGCNIGGFSQYSVVYINPASTCAQDSQVFREGPELSLVSSLTLTSTTYSDGAYIWGRYAVVGDGNNADFIDLSNVAAPVKVASVTQTQGNHVAWPWAFGKYLYFSDGGDTHFETWDVSNIHSATLVNNLNTTAARQVTNRIVGNQLYVAGDHLSIYNITNRASPVLLGSVALPGFGASGNFSLVVRGVYAYVGVVTFGGGQNQLAYIINVSDPTTPTIVGTITGFLCPMAGCDNENSGVLSLSGRYLYVGNANNDNEANCNTTPQTSCGLLVFDVSDPTSPVFVTGVAVGWTGEFDVANFAEIDGSKLYFGIFPTDNVTCPAQGCLQVFDITNPASPTRIASAYTGTSKTATGVGFYGRYLLVTTLDASKTTLDIYDRPGVNLQSAYFGEMTSETGDVTGDFQAGGVIFAGTGLKAGPLGLNSQGPVGGAFIRFIPVTFATLPTTGDSTQAYCSDCTVTSALDNTCASGGSGSMAFRINGAWKCVL